MVKSHSISQDFVNSRLDRWIRKKICEVPQGFLEKTLRNKNITVNKLRVKSSYKLKLNDKVFLILHFR